MNSNVAISDVDAPLLTAALMAEMDEVIESIPDYQLRSVDHHMPGLDPAVSIDPWSNFDALRAERGDVVPYENGRYGNVQVYNGFGHDLSRPNFAVMGFSTIRAMVMDKENFINGGAYGTHAEAQNAGIVTVNELDGAEHRTMRRLFEMEVLSRQYLIDLAENTIGPTADYLAQRIRKKFDRGEQAELCRDLALPLLFVSMARIVGLPLTGLSRFVSLGERAFNGPRDFAAAQQAAAELHDYFTEVYERRRAAGDLEGGDLMSLMTQAERDGRKFSPHEIVIYCRFLLPAGIETTWRQVANIAYALALHPDQFQALVDDPSLHAGAIEEVLRWLPSGSVLPRIAAKDTVLAGVEIPAGSSMCGIFMAANRDPAIWPDGHLFDIRRERKPHLTFSAGTHACMGQQLARQSFTHAVRALTQFLPDMRLAVPAEELRTTGYIIRCPDKVPVMAA